MFSEIVVIVIFGGFMRDRVWTLKIATPQKLWFPSELSLQSAAEVQITERAEYVNCIKLHRRS